MMARMRILMVMCLLASSVMAQDAALQGQLENVYAFWRNAMVKRDYVSWAKVTASHRQGIVRNRLNSERRVFPKAIFEVPAAPPSLAGLKAVQIKRNGATAKCIYFGKIDFGVGGDPTENLLVIDYVQEATGWKYDIAEFVNLAVLPEIRKELAAGDLSYIEKTPEFAPSGKVPALPIVAPIAKYIGKVYVFCPGRVVDVTVNKMSQHRFGNAKEAELLMGGVRDGNNEISYAVKSVPGGKGNEAMTIRVYAFSQVEGVKPIKIFEYQVQEGQPLKATGSMQFQLDAPTSAKLLGK